MSLSKVLKKLRSQGLLQPLDLRPPNPLANNYNENAYCEFHQTKGHETDKCVRLRHEIQDLIEQGKISDPQKSSPTSRITRSQISAVYLHLKPLVGIEFYDLVYAFVYLKML